LIERGLKEIILWNEAQPTKDIDIEIRTSSFQTLKPASERLCWIFPVKALRRMYTLPLEFLKLTYDKFRSIVNNSVIKNLVFIEVQSLSAGLKHQKLFGNLIK
jgi:hypothetical protein